MMDLKDDYCNYWAINWINLSVPRLGEFEVSLKDGARRITLGRTESLSESCFVIRMSNGLSSSWTLISSSSSSCSIGSGSLLLELIKFVVEWAWLMGIIDILDCVGGAWLCMAFCCCWCLSCERSFFLAGSLLSSKAAKWWNKISSIRQSTALSTHLHAPEHLKRHEKVTPVMTPLWNWKSVGSTQVLLLFLSWVRISIFALSNTLPAIVQDYLISSIGFSDRKMLLQHFKPPKMGIEWGKCDEMRNVFPLFTFWGLIESDGTREFVKISNKFTSRYYIYIAW